MSHVTPGHVPVTVTVTFSPQVGAANVAGADA